MDGGKIRWLSPRCEHWWLSPRIDVQRLRSRVATWDFRWPWRAGGGRLYGGGLASDFGFKWRRCLDGASKSYGCKVSQVSVMLRICVPVLLVLEWLEKIPEIWVEICPVRWPYWCSWWLCGGWEYTLRPCPCAVAVPLCYYSGWHGRALYGYMLVLWRGNGHIAHRRKKQKPRSFWRHGHRWMNFFNNMIGCRCGVILWQRGVLCTINWEKPSCCMSWVKQRTVEFWRRWTDFGWWRVGYPRGGCRETEEKRIWHSSGSGL